MPTSPHTSATAIMETPAALQALLEDPEQTKNFLYFLKLEFGEENLSFYLEVEEYKRTLDVDKAISIINEYIKPYSEKEVNISYKTKCAVANRIESIQQNGGLKDAPQVIAGGLTARDRSTSVFTQPSTDPHGLIDLFREAQEEVFQLLFLGPFQRFVSREAVATAEHVLSPEQIYDLCIDTDGWVHLHNNKKDTSKAHMFTNLQKNLFFLRASILVCNTVASISEYLMDVTHQPEYDINIENTSLDKSDAGIDVLRTKYKNGREEVAQRFSRNVKDSTIIGYSNEKHQFWIITPCDSKSAISILYYIYEFDISADADEYDAKAKDVLVMLRTVKSVVEPPKRGFFSTRQKAATVSTVEPSSSSCFPGLRRAGLRPKSSSYASPPTNSALLSSSSPPASPSQSRPASPSPDIVHGSSTSNSPASTPPASPRTKKHFRLTLSKS